MLQEGLWSRQRKRKKHCQRRERKAHFGELVQLDGSFHDWLEGRGPHGCLMNWSTMPPGPRCAAWASKKLSGPQWACCGPEWKNTECRERSTRTGKTSTCASRRQKNCC